MNEKTNEDPRELLVDWLIPAGASVAFMILTLWFQFSHASVLAISCVFAITLLLVVVAIIVFILVDHNRIWEPTSNFYATGYFWGACLFAFLALFPISIGYHWSFVVAFAIIAIGLFLWAIHAWLGQALAGTIGGLIAFVSSCVFASLGPMGIIFSDFTRGLAVFSICAVLFFAVALVYVFWEEDGPSLPVPIKIFMTLLGAIFSAMIVIALYYWWIW